ncbi:uncharacterized protein ACBR49_006948 [Aulostomus maculatus]
MLMVWCVRAHSESGCAQTEFLHPNGSCLACHVCGPGEQLSEDCGFGDGGESVCVVCEEGTFSTDTDVEPCKRCTQCNLLNRLEEKACSPTGNTLCGQCLPEYYELRSITGEAELCCVPCYNGDTLHDNCLIPTPFRAGVKAETYSMVLIGSATASLIFLIALLLWVFLLTAERFKQVSDYCPGSEGLLSETEGAAKPQKPPSKLAEDPPRCLNSLENEVHPASIVINVTTNVKPPGQEKENSHVSPEEQRSSCYSMEEMEQKLQKIWQMAQGQGIETLDYDSIQDLSVLLDSADNRNALRRLGWSLGVPPQVVSHLQGFQDLFQYLRTSTYTLLPQLAQAAALLPNPEVVARIHQAVANK